MSEMPDPIELLRDQEVALPDRRRVEAVRTELLLRSAVPARRRARWPFVIGAVAAAATAVLVLRGDARVARGHVHAHEGADVDVASESPDEIVKLHDGAIDVEVDPLQAGERFRVVVGASEVEVRGTAFTVVASHDALVDVRVAHGRVEVRAPGEPFEVLGAGEAWRAKLAAAATVTGTASGSASASASATATGTATAAAAGSVTATATARRPPPPPAEISAKLNPPVETPTHLDEHAYNDAWSALREKRYLDAADLYARALALAPDGALADDARYWRAVALARAGRSAAAITAFRVLVDEHPRTLHRGEASAMLGWLLVDAKQFPEAEQRFTAAASDPSDKVRASAESGLRALHP